MRSVKLCEKQLSRSKKIAIIAHTMPDADTLCSAVALKKLIKLNYDSEGKKIIDIFVDQEEINELYQPIIKGVEINTQNAKKYDLAISVDCSNISRLGCYQNLFKKTHDTINLDHHETNDNFARNNLVLKTSSTCETMFHIFNVLQKTIPDDVCKLLYSGIITDTTNLTQGTVTIRTHKVISEFMARHIDLEALKEHFFKNNTKSKAFLLQKALANLNFFANDRIAFMKLTKQDFAETDSTFEDSVGIVNHGVEIKGVDIAIIAIKQEDNSYYVSLRSKNNIDVGIIAKEMGGGGHETVAAFTYSGMLTDLKDKLFALCKEELKKHPVYDNAEDLFGNDSDEEENNDEEH